MCLKQWISRRFCCCQGFNRRIVAMKESWDEVNFLLMLTASSIAAVPAENAEKANSPSVADILCKHCFDSDTLYRDVNVPV